MCRLSVSEVTTDYRLTVNRNTLMANNNYWLSPVQDVTETQPILDQCSTDITTNNIMSTNS